MHTLYKQPNQGSPKSIFQTQNEQLNSKPSAMAFSELKLSTNGLLNLAFCPLRLSKLLQ